MALGQPFDVNEYIQQASAMARIAARIGINRTAKELSLREYVTTPGKPPAPELDQDTAAIDRDDWVAADEA
jgi:hypothetical protein